MPETPASQHLTPRHAVRTCGLVREGCVAKKGGFPHTPKVQEWLGHAHIATTRLSDRRQSRPEESPTFKVAYCTGSRKGVHIPIELRQACEAERGRVDGNRRAKGGCSASKTGIMPRHRRDQ